MAAVGSGGGEAAAACSEMGVGGTDCSVLGAAGEGRREEHAQQNVVSKMQR